MYCATEKVVLHQRIWIMLEVKADLLYKDHISSSPASRQGDVAYALLWMLFLVFFALFFVFSYRAAQRSTGGRYFCPNGYNRKKWQIFFQYDSHTLIHQLGTVCYFHHPYHILFIRTWQIRFYPYYYAWSIYMITKLEIEMFTKSVP